MSNREVIFQMGLVCERSWPFAARSSPRCVGIFMNALTAKFRASSSDATSSDDTETFTITPTRGYVQTQRGREGSTKCTLRRDE